MMKPKNFSDGIQKMSKFFNKPLTQAQLEIYYEILRDMPDKIFQKAVMDFIEMNKFFPTPGEFKEYWRSVEGPAYKREDKYFEEQVRLPPEQIAENFKRILDAVEKVGKDVSGLKV